MTINTTHSAPIAEAALLGAMILEPKIIPDVRGMIPTASVFTIRAHEDLYDAICEADNRDGTVDLVVLSERCKTIDSLQAAGGVRCLERLAAECPGPVGAPVWAREVMDAWRRRRLLDSCEAARFALSQAPDTLQNVLDGLETDLLALHDGATRNEAQPLGELLDAEYERITSGRGRENYYPTHYQDLDKALVGGVGGGDFVVIACRPSMGKTAAMCCIAERMTRHGIKVGVFSMEMDRASVSKRFMSIASGIPLETIQTGKDTDRFADQMMRLPDEIAHLRGNVVVDDMGGLTPMQLRARARGMVRRYKVQAIFVDYIQLMHTGGRSENRQVEVSEISRNLKALARELNIPIVCAAQLNRLVEGRADNRPRMSDLRESGSIEQDADTIILLHREEYYHVNDPRWAELPENYDKIGLAEWIVAKQRNGPTGVVKFTWQAECARFVPHAGRQYVEDAPVHAEPRAYQGTFRGIPA